MPGRSASKRQSARKMLRNPVNTWAPSFPVLWINDRECPPILAPCIDTERGQMPFKPNYRFERAERDRAKEAKKREVKKAARTLRRNSQHRIVGCVKEPGPRESLRTA